MLPQNPTYTFIQTYTFINFKQKVSPIRLFPPMLLLIFKEISHRNSRVGRSSCIWLTTDLNQLATNATLWKEQR